MGADPVLVEGTPALRRPASRGDTAAILSYYQSDLVREPYQHLIESTTRSEACTRQACESDSSPSSPSSGGKEMKNDSFGSTVVHRRKRSNHAESGMDNRRFVIVPPKVDTLGPPGPGRGDETGQYVYVPSAPNSAQASLPSPSAGRGGSLFVNSNAQLATSVSALVAHPDTNLLLSSHDTFPPPSSPSSSSSLSPSTPKNPHPSPSAKQEKSRRALSTTHSRSSSRDIGIVGTGRTLTRRDLPQDLAIRDTTSDCRPPIFQTPSSRSSSPDISDTSSPEPGPLAQTPSPVGVVHVPAMSASVEPIHNISNGHAVLALAHSPITSSHAPEQGQVPPVAAPSSAAPSAYLHYQPGVHSKAGPLPPPPRAMFDIDFNAPPPPRPPRLRSPSPRTSQKISGTAAPSITVRLASKASVASIHQMQFGTAPPMSTESSSESSEYSPEPETEPIKPDDTVHHSREGAFPPSAILVTPADRYDSPSDKSIRLAPEPPSKDQLPNLPPDILDATPVITAGLPSDELSPSTARSPELRRENSWISNSNDSGRASSENSRRAFEGIRPDTPQESNDQCPSIKEFAPEDSPSEPKRKGGLLTNLKRYSSLPRPPSTRTSSIFTRSPSPRSPRPRIRARSPDAMRFRDVLNKRFASERAIGYANKINELSMYDCGLGDWVTSMKERGSSKVRLVPASPSQKSDTSFAPRPRHTSRGSISSEATFPLRADAYIATDLSQRDIDVIPSPNIPPPALPYPALAGVPHSTTSTGSQLSHSSSLSVGSKTTGGFFSSLGRNASTRKDSFSKPAHPARLVKLPPSVPNPRPVQITNAPSVPGGPRALPNRMQRSRTLMLAPLSSSPETVSPSPLMRRRSNTLKRPSFFGRSTGPPPHPDAPTSAEFMRQVERLADLLPHADKDVLAGYLRRAGQDILAIGQYLEDEKNGSLRRG